MPGKTTGRAEPGRTAAVPRQRPATETERAKLWFLDSVRQIPGVVHVETYGGKTLVEQSIRVYVGDGDLDAEHQVYQLKGETYERYPEARLDLSLFEQSDLNQHAPEILPAAE